MISTKTLLRALIILLSLDIAMTLIMVGWMGATELNVLASVFGFAGFMVLKIAASAVAIYIVCKYCLPSMPTITRYWLWMFGVVYAAGCASNVYQIVGVVA